MLLTKEATAQVFGLQHEQHESVAAQIRSNTLMMPWHGQVSLRITVHAASHLLSSQTHVQVSLFDGPQKSPHGKRLARKHGRSVSAASMLLDSISAAGAGALVCFGHWLLDMQVAAGLLSTFLIVCMHMLAHLNRCSLEMEAVKAATRPSAPL